MVSNNTNKVRKTSGFTIVELLIVIVVIGILAAITIVAYNGVQARANTTKNDTLAKEVADKAEVYAADNEGAYPATAAAFALIASPATSALSTTAKGAVQATAAKDKVQYVPCPASGTQTGAKITGWSYVTGAASDKPRTVGTGC